MGQFEQIVFFSFFSGDRSFEVIEPLHKTLIMDRYILLDHLSCKILVHLQNYHGLLGCLLNHRYIYRHGKLDGLFKNNSVLLSKTRTLEDTTSQCN